MWVCRPPELVRTLEAQSIEENTHLLLGRLSLTALRQGGTPFIFFMFFFTCKVNFVIISKERIVKSITIRSSYFTLFKAVFVGLNHLLRRVTRTILGV